MAVPLIAAAGLVTLEPQSNQRACQQRGFFSHRPCRTKLRKPGLQPFVPASPALALTSDKNCYAPPAHRATIVFSAFGRSFFADGGGWS